MAIRVDKWPVPGYSLWHRAVCGDLTSAFDFTHPADAVVPKLPDTSNYAVLDAQQRTMLAYSIPAKNQPLFQESGMRFSSKLPYELHVNATVTAGISVLLSFGNTGAQASTLTIQDNASGSGGPLFVKVEPGKVVEQYWALRKSGNWYDFSVTASPLRSVAANDSNGRASQRDGRLAGSDRLVNCSITAICREIS